MSSTGRDIGYILSINHSKINEVKMTDPLAREFIFNDLSPANTLFLIRLQTFNSIGRSNYVVETMEKTFESGELKFIQTILVYEMNISVPHHPPSNIRIESVNGTSVKIHWNPLTTTDQAGLITNYKVIYFISHVKRNDCLLRSSISQFHLHI